MKPEQTYTAVRALAESTPSFAAAGAFLAGITINQWMAAASIGFILTQWAFLIWRWRREAKRELEGKPPTE